MAYAMIKSRYNEKDIRWWIPEACDPLIQIWGPDLKKGKSYWQVGTSAVTRVKISALSEKASLRTEKRTTITGTASENYEKIKTLGTARIHVCNNFYVEAHVTRSRNVAPFVVDGILGLDFIESEGWILDRKAEIFHRPNKLHSPISLLPANHYFPDYAKTLREKMKSLNLSKEKNEWASVSQRTQQARPYLPPEVENDRRSPVIDVLDDYSDCLFLPGDTIPPTKLLKYPIKSNANDTFALPQPPHSQKDWNLIEAIVTDLLRQDIIRVSTSPYNSPVGLLPKKADARGNISFRLSVDYSKLGKLSETENFPIPEIYDAVDQIHGSKYFSVLDLASAGYHIPIEPQDRRKTAFTTRSGHYEFQRLPANMKNGGPYMQRLMNKVLEGIRKDVFVCHDDMLIHATTIEEHEIRIRKVFDRLRAHGLKIQAGKCQLFKSQVLYLGFLITDEGIRPDPAKIEKLQLSQRPASPAALRSWLGLLSTHRRFLKGYAGGAQPMFDMLKCDYFNWTSDAVRYYEMFQRMLTGDLLLRYPDWNRTFTVQSGCDDYGIYAGLMQQNSSTKQAEAIVWDSRTYSLAEFRLSETQRKKLASDWGMKTFSRSVQNTKSLDELTGNLSLRD